MGRRKVSLLKVGLNGLQSWKTFISNDLSMLNGSGFEEEDCAQKENWLKP